MAPREREPSIVTVTLNPAVDQVCWLDEVAEGTKLRAREARFEPGGGGVNVARALRGLEATVLALWSKGGQTGVLMGELLDEVGVLHRPVPIGERTRVNLVAFESENDTREYLFDMPGPELGEEEIQRWAKEIAGVSARYVVVSGSPPPGLGADRFARLVRRLPEDARVVLDTSGPSLERLLDQGVHLAMPNRHELADLVGDELDSTEAIREAAAQLVEDGSAEIVVVTMGSEGAVAVSREETIHVDAPEVPDLSNAGAGDSTTAAVTCRLAEGAGLHEALVYGVAAGADAVRRRGTTLCQREGVEELVERME